MAGGTATGSPTGSRAKKDWSQGMREIDREILERVSGGDQEAFAELVREYAPRVYNLALRMLRNRQDAEDVVQETFLSAYEKIRTFDGRSSLYTWLYRIAVNASLMKLRSKHHTKTFVPLDESDPEEFVRPVLVDWSQHPAEKLLDQEAREVMERAIQALPDSYRSVFVLRDLEQLSTRETAKILGLSEDNVKTRLRRARLFLRNLLSEYFEEKAAAGAN
ncbi:MAG: sigma-70 family RNA polymerase sigma factor [candidate division KSB1 bacterium]|nr:sigma-70 family RNA polymerase sigma factor [candidate division KSB1 bacterium]